MRDKQLSHFLDTNIERKTVVVQGLGFVGAVMSLVVANSGRVDYAVIGVDLPSEQGKERVAKINSGIFPFQSSDPKVDLYYSNARDKNNFIATTDVSAFEAADVVIVDVNLDVQKSNSSTGELVQFDVDLNPFREAIRTIGKHCAESCLILVETTVPPGTCSKVVVPILEEELKARGLDSASIKVGHSYERVMPGPSYIDSIENFPRVYSGVSKRSADATKIFLETVINTDVYPLTRLDNTNASETAKVLENSYRAMNIAFVVEWSRMAEKSGINLYGVIDAIRDRDTHANLMKPGLGVGGYCLTKDPLLASWSFSENFMRGEALSLSEKAVSINDNMPFQAYTFLEERIGSVRGKRFMLFGVSYRGDVGDTRFSPVESFYNYLKGNGASIDYFDPFVPSWAEVGFDGLPDLQTALDCAADVITISAGHSDFREDSFLEALLRLDKTTIFDPLGFLTDDQISRLVSRHELVILGRGDL